MIVTEKLFKYITIIIVSFIVLGLAYIFYPTPTLISENNYQDKIDSLNTELFFLHKKDSLHIYNLKQDSIERDSIIRYYDNKIDSIRLLTIHELDSTITSFINNYKKIRK